MIARPRIALAAVALVALGLVTGCAPQTEAAAPAHTSPTTQATAASPSPTASETADVVPGRILDVELGEPFLDAAERTGAAQTNGCSWVATAEQQGYQLQLQGPEAPVEPGTLVHTVAVTTPVGNAAGGQVGPLTAEGIGIGSTLDEAMAAYPEAEVWDEPDTPRSYLEIATGENSASLYLAYSEGTPVVWGILTTTQETPDIAPCE